MKQSLEIAWTVSSAHAILAMANLNSEKFKFDAPETRLTLQLGVATEKTQTIPSLTPAPAPSPLLVIDTYICAYGRGIHGMLNHVAGMYMNTSQ